MAILIEDGTVTIYSDVNKKVISFDAFMTAMSENAAFVMPFLPDKTKAFSSIEGKTALIIEREPNLQSMTYTYGDRKSFTFNVMWPWAYYIFILQNDPCVLQQLGMFYAKKRVMSMEDEVGWIATPNVRLENSRKYGVMCYGQIDIPNNPPIHSFVSQVLAAVSGSNFNQDYFDYDAHGIDVLRTNINKYIKMAAEEAEGAKAGPYKTMLQHVPAEPRIAYLYAWQKYSEEVKEKEFLESINLHTVSSYKSVLNEIRDYFKEL